MIIHSLHRLFSQFRQFLRVDFSDLEIDLSMEEIICDLHAGCEDARESSRCRVSPVLPAHTRICAATWQMTESSEGAVRTVVAA